MVLEDTICMGLLLDITGLDILIEGHHLQAQSPHHHLHSVSFPFLYRMQHDTFLHLFFFFFFFIQRLLFYVLTMGIGRYYYPTTLLYTFDSSLQMYLVRYYEVYRMNTSEAYYGFNSGSNNGMSLVANQ
jgi:hypothetical protein